MIQKITDYFNGIQFSFKFSELADWISDNPNISVNHNYTTLAFYINHSHPDYNFFEGPANLWLSLGDEKKFLTSIVASNSNEVLLPFGSIIQDLIDNDLDIDDEMILTRLY